MTLDVARMLPGCCQDVDSNNKQKKYLHFQIKNPEQIQVIPCQQMTSETTGTGNVTALMTHAKAIADLLTRVMSHPPIVRMRDDWQNEQVWSELFTQWITWASLRNMR